jgi:aryl-alcohol dehydrogenase-like predicted oxidoreductase
MNTTGGTMEYRNLGKTNFRVSALGLGTWAMGGDEWGPSDDQTSLDVLRAAIEAGINLIDTADVYGMGHSEELVGEAVAAEEGVVVVTKVGWDIYSEPRIVGGSRRRYDAPYIVQAFDQSCRRLRRDPIDVYLLHNPTRSDLVESEGLDTLRKLQEAERIRWIGASVGSEDDAVAAIDAGIDVLELPFNVVRSWARRVLDHADEHGVGVLAREPLERGLLTGKYREDEQFQEGDHRRNKGRDWLAAAQPHIARVTEVAQRIGRAPVEVALAYPLSYPQVASTIAGARSVEQLEANVAGAAARLNAADRTQLEGQTSDV